MFHLHLYHHVLPCLCHLVRHRHQRLPHLVRSQLQRFRLHQRHHVPQVPQVCQLPQPFLEPQLPLRLLFVR